MEEEEVTTKPTPKRPTLRQSIPIIGIVALIIGFIMFIIGIALVTVCIFNRKPEPQQPPNQPKKKPKPKPPPQPKEPEKVVKKEDEIHQEAKEMLVAEFQNTSIQKNIIIQSDTEAEQDVQEIDED